MDATAIQPCYIIAFIFHRMEVRLRDETRHYIASLRRSRRWNIDLRPLLEDGVDLAGIVLHDDIAPLRRARAKLEEVSGIDVCETDSKRFKGVVVDARRNRTWKRVLLQETGMGSMNASLAVYELAAALCAGPSSARRVIKVGTCSGLHPELSAGTVVAPLYALADEGATKWNSIQDGAELSDWLKGRFEAACDEKAVTCARDWLTRQWREHLQKRSYSFIGGPTEGPDWWLSFSERHEYSKDNPRPEAAIWSVDNFHGARQFATEIYGSIRDWVLQLKPKYVPFVFENECSSHYSACNATDLDIATALIVSWSSANVTHFVHEHEDERERALKLKVHDNE